MNNNAQTLFQPSAHVSDKINTNVAESQLAGGAHLKKLAVGRALRITTQNRVYMLRKTDQGYTICGHPRYCPQPTECVPSGSTWGGSLLRVGFVGRGMRFQAFMRNAEITVTTSVVEEVEETEAAAEADSQPS